MTTSLKVPEPLAAEFAAVARRRGISESALIREAVRTFLSTEQAEPRSALDRTHDPGWCIRGTEDLSTNPEYVKGFGEMIRDVILDTGPLVALMNVRDRDHHWVRDQWRGSNPLCSPARAVVVEACFLARRLGPGRGKREWCRWFARGLLNPSFRLPDHAEAVCRLMRRYRDVPMSLADACLVRMSELHPASPVLTLDRGFAVYRKNRSRRIPLLSLVLGP